jgi:hypothetical protein
LKADKIIIEFGKGMSAEFSKFYFLSLLMRGRASEFIFVFLPLFFEGLKNFLDRVSANCYYRVKEMR